MNRDEEISESLWSSSAAMNRSTSEWALERFLEEFSPATPTSHPDDDAAIIQITTNPPVGMDSHQYRNFLKNQLDLACAAVALSRESTTSSSAAKPVESQAQLPVESDAVPHKGAGHSLLPMARDELDDGPLGVAGLPPVQNKATPQCRQTTSGSSKEDSDDDDLDGDTENADPSGAKRARRMLSNRESARRSRRRKQAQMGELETQVGQLRVEHSTLLNRLSDMNHKYDNAAVDNRILKADIETLRAKVKMAEQTVKRVTGINPILLAMSNLNSTGIPTNESAIPLQQNSTQFFHQPVPGITPPITQHQRVDRNFSGNSSIPLAGNPKNNDAPRSNIGG